MTQHYIPGYQNSLLHLYENIAVLTASVYQLNVTTSQGPVIQFAARYKPPLWSHLACCWNYNFIKLVKCYSIVIFTV